jgi:hypothetical protein
LTFTPRLRVKSHDELNALLLDKAIAYARASGEQRRPKRFGSSCKTKVAFNMEAFIGGFARFPNRQEYQEMAASRFLTFTSAPNRRCSSVRRLATVR